MTARDSRGRIIWADLLQHAAAIVASYDTPVTLRQLFYRLVADGSLPNLRTQYTHLAENTAAARRDGWFPALTDRTSRIEASLSFTGPHQALSYLHEICRRDRTAGQPWTILLGIEKAGMSAQLDAWFTGPLGIPHIAPGGYASQTLCDEVRAYVGQQGRPAVLVYAGDHDPTGEDIDRDLVARTGCWDKVIRVALSRDQVLAYRLPENSSPEVAAKLGRDPRARAFAGRHGDLAQYEVDALDPEVLRNMFRAAIGGFWDEAAHREVLAAEQAGREQLRALLTPNGDDL